MFVALLIIIAVIIAVAWRLATYGKELGHVMADEVHMVKTSDLWSIRLCRYLPKKGPGEPVLLVHGFMANQFNFALPEGQSLADVLSADGYDCWLIELRGCVSSVPPFGRSLSEPAIEDYIFKDIPAALQYIQQKTRYPKVHWIGHSLGGMLLYAYQAAFGGKAIASGTTIGSPINFEGVRLNGVKPLLLLRYLPSSIFRGLQRLGVVLAYRFKLKSSLVPVNWNNMNPELDGRAFSNVVEAPPLPVAKELAFCAANRVWRIQNDEIDVVEAMNHFDVPLFAIFGAGDSFVPLHTIDDFFDKLPIKDKDLMILSKENENADDYSHVDLMFGRYSADEVFVPILSWVQDHTMGGPGKVESVKMRAKRTAQADGEPVAAEEAQAPESKPRRPRRKRPVAPKEPQTETETAAKAPAKPRARRPAPKKKPAQPSEM